MIEYDPRYLAGILFFNEQDYFEAHEVWEELWAESHGMERRFYQGLIQAAVGLHHFATGNLGGAVKLYRTSRDYMAGCSPGLLGLNNDDFWSQMVSCYALLLNNPEPDRSLRPDPTRMPIITLDPTPTNWPDPEDYRSDEG